MNRTLFSLTAAALVLIAGCKDSGTTEPVTTTPPVDPPAGTTVSFQQKVLPILTQYGCVGCHGGTSGLTVGTVNGLKAGGLHGAAVTAGDSTNSIIIRKLSTAPPFGDRMPQGGPYLPDSTVRIIKTWIAQGAQNN